MGLYAGVLRNKVLQVALVGNGGRGRVARLLAIRIQHATAATVGAGVAKAHLTGRPLAGRRRRRGALAGAALCRSGVQRHWFWARQCEVTAPWLAGAILRGWGCGSVGRHGLRSARWGRRLPWRGREGMESGAQGAAGEPAAPAEMCRGSHGGACDVAGTFAQTHGTARGRRLKGHGGVQEGSYKHAPGAAQARARWEGRSDRDMHHYTRHGAGAT